MRAAAGSERTRRKAQARFVKPRKRVVEPRQGSRVVAIQAPHERHGLGGIGANDRLPHRLGFSAAGHGHLSRLNAKAWPEGRKCAGVPQQVAQRVALGPEPRERFVVEARKAVVEKRRRPLRENGVDDLRVWDLLLQERLTPHGGIEWQRHRLAGSSQTS